MIARPRFTIDDAERANTEWGANCGPGAIAAVCGLTLDELRPHMGDFESKHYTNPTLMWEVLRNIGVRFSYRGGQFGKSNWPRFGLCRVQWTGPWTRPDVPARAAYRHTHWIGAARDAAKGVAVFDINMMANGSGWASLGDWSSSLVPWLLEECEPRADGDWYLTHVVEVDPARACREGAQ